MLAGAQVFAQKDCGKCHTVRGAGGTAGPDLSRAKSATSFYEIGAAMWNHLPRMGARMRQMGIERARLTPVEAANVVAYIYTAQYFDPAGDARRGESLFTSKACASCHRVGGKGGTVGPALDGLKRANSPVIVAAAMWNHAPAMQEALARRNVARPRLEPQELLDIIAYVAGASRDTSTETQQVIPGTPDRGRVLFAEKKCSTCHSVTGVGGTLAPDLGRPGQHSRREGPEMAPHAPQSLTAFAARMWNHAPAMLAKMKEAKITPPTLSGQEMADIVAHLFASRYFEAGGDARRGGDLVRGKGCLGCHAVAGKGATGGIDFARSDVVGTPGALVAALWNHGRGMEAEAEKRRIALPELRGAELADIAAYLRSVSRDGAPRPAAR
jgi:mono/diheme cytochrome c family protein